MIDDSCVPWWARTIAQAVYIRDDLDGYGAVLAWDGPPRPAPRVNGSPSLT